MKTLEIGSSTEVAVDEFDAIYKSEFNYVWNSLRRFGVAPRNLPDVTHDVFVATFRRLHTFDASRPLRPWMLGITFRVARDHLRLARNTFEVLQEYGEPEDPELLPDAKAVAAQQWRCVDRALQSLDLGLRSVLVMHDFLGYSGAEVARTIGIPIKTAFSRLHRARALFVMSARSAVGAADIV